MSKQTYFSSLLTIPLLLSCTLLSAQHQRTASLTPSEVEAVAENAVYPVVRVNLYTKYLDERAAKIKDLGSRPRSGQRVLKIDDALQDFTALMDEMGSNLDQYSDRHSDIRKALKPLTEATPKWLNILRMLPGESGFDLARKEAIESGEELADQATRLLREQNDYFALHKDEKDQERNDDQVKPDEPKPIPPMPKSPQH
jgi:hypothetical protein